MIIQTNATSVGSGSVGVVADVPAAGPPSNAPVHPAQRAADVKPPTSEQLKAAVDVINQVLRQYNHSLEFSFDKGTNITVVKLVDTETGDLIGQIPSEQTLAIARSIDQVQQGLLLKQKA